MAVTNQEMTPLNINLFETNSLTIMLFSPCPTCCGVPTCIPRQLRFLIK
uniref:Uncharacterized protein n=1 Tax=Anguilla anguilla TaxID=7936 RepID=A0A0E9PZA2_ANGAN